MFFCRDKKAGRCEQSMSGSAARIDGWRSCSELGRRPGSTRFDPYYIEAGFRGSCLAFGFWTNGNRREKIQRLFQTTHQKKKSNFPPVGKRVANFTPDTPINPRGG